MNKIRTVSLNTLRKQRAAYETRYYDGYVRMVQGKVSLTICLAALKSQPWTPNMDPEPN